MIDRYSRQTIFIGEEGQLKLAASYAVVVGCGALGTVIATSLVRAGVGRIRIIDRDFIEYHNLQRQVIFDEEDVKNQLPKAIAAERHLKKVNSSIQIEGIVADINYANIEGLVEGADILLDGLDNFETRFLINDVSLKLNIPWVYGGAISSMGMTMNVIPHQGPCFRCFNPNPTQRGPVQTCDTAGVIGPAPFLIASLQTAEAMKILLGSKDVNRNLVVVDVWKTAFNTLKVSPRPGCPACQGKYEFLEGKYGRRATVLCGQNAVQVSGRMTNLSLGDLAAKLKPVGEVNYNEFMLRFAVDGREMVIFPDGRAIVKNTTDETLARGLYAKYVGT